MKKVFLVLLAAGLFVACGNKNQAEEAEAIDSVVTEEVVVDTPVVEEVVEEVVAEAAPAEAAPAKKTLKQVAKETGESVAKTAIEEAGAEATNAIQTKKGRR